MEGHPGSSKDDDNKPKRQRKPSDVNTNPEKYYEELKKFYLAQLPEDFPECIYDLEEIKALAENRRKIKRACDSEWFRCHFCKLWPKTLVKLDVLRHMYSFHSLNELNAPSFGTGCVKMPEDHRKLFLDGKLHRRQKDSPPALPGEGYFMSPEKIFPHQILETDNLSEKSNAPKRNPSILTPPGSPSPKSSPPKRQKTR